MTHGTYRLVVLLSSTVPVLALAAAAFFAWDDFLGPRDIGILAIMFLLCGSGLTVGYHRLFAHRSFEAVAPVRATLAALGSMVGDGPLIAWVAVHRKHHAFTDVDGDPHSPHLLERQGLRGIAKGLWHAHMGWMLDPKLDANLARYARDLLRDPIARWVSVHFVGLVLLGLAIPFAAGFMISGGSFAAGLTALLWGGLVRLFLQQHLSYSVNSICHFFGRRRFATEDESHNVAWLAVPTLGEAWHHNHHAFPTSASHGLKPSEVDVSALVIRGLEKLGLASSVVRVSPAQLREKQEGVVMPAELVSPTAGSPGG